MALIYERLRLVVELTAQFLCCSLVSGDGNMFFPPLVLHGLDLESEHCMIENQNGTVTLVPLGAAQCSVNGVQATEPSQLNQGEEQMSV